jgi:hypothetical protein
VPRSVPRQLTSSVGAGAARSPLGMARSERQSFAASPRPRGGPDNSSVCGPAGVARDVRQSPSWSAPPDALPRQFASPADGEPRSPRH